MTMRFDIQVVARRIGIPVEEWPGRCSTIAHLMLKAGYVPGGKLVRGNWVGPIHESSLFAGRPFTGHTWIETEDEETIVDPTRWTFEMKQPYIFVGAFDPDRYDPEGNLIRSMMRGDYPAWDSEQKIVSLEFIEDILDRLACISGQPEIFSVTPNQYGDFTRQQISWFANLSPNTIGEFWVREVYSEIQRVGMKAAIPYDNWKKYMERK